MPANARVRRPPKAARTRADGDTEHPAAEAKDAAEVEAERERKAAETDALLEEIDELLGSDQEAQAFVNSYHQKGGE